jgi:hypothetical protein
MPRMIGIHHSIDVEPVFVPALLQLPCIHHASIPSIQKQVAPL